MFIARLSASAILYPRELGQWPCASNPVGNACAHYAEVPCGKDAVKRSGCVNSAGQSEDSKEKALSGADFVCAVANPAGIT